MTIGQAGVLRRNFHYSVMLTQPKGFQWNFPFHFFLAGELFHEAWPESVPWQFSVLQQAPYSLSKGSRKLLSILSAAQLAAGIHHDLLQSLPNSDITPPSCSLCFHMSPFSVMLPFCLQKLSRSTSSKNSVPDEGNISHLLKGSPSLWRKEIHKLFIKWLLPIVPCKLKLFVLILQFHTALSQPEK